MLCLILVVILFLYGMHLLEERVYINKATQICKKLYDNNTKFYLSDISNETISGKCNNYEVVIKLGQPQPEIKQETPANNNSVWKVFTDPENATPEDVNSLVSRIMPLMLLGMIVIPFATFMLRVMSRD